MAVAVVARGQSSAVASALIDRSGHWHLVEDSHWAAAGPEEVAARPQVRLERWKWIE